MKLKSILVVVICLLLLTPILNDIVYSNDIDIQYIRIGLKKPQKTSFKVRLYAITGFNLGLIDEEFTTLFSLDEKEIYASYDSYYHEIDGEFIPVINEEKENAVFGPFHLEISETFDTYANAMQKVEILRGDGIIAYPSFDGNYKVWIGRFINEEEALNNKENFEKSINKELNIIKDNKRRVILENNKKEVILIFNLDQCIYFQSKIQDNRDSIIQIEDSNYRDFITFNIFDNELIPINYVSIDHYLYGVVPREISANWPAEAIKAQAVAARNYALVNFNRFESRGYDLDDTHNSQVYAGYDWENEKSNNAVDETSSVAIRYNGNAIPAFYHSSSGGHTENSENIWSLEVPYLRGVDDEFSLGSPNDNWQLVLDKDQIREKLLSNDIDLGEIASIEPLSISEYGRVLEIMIKGTKGDKIFEKEAIRKILGYGYLKSTWFNVESDADIYVVDGLSTEPTKKILNELTIISDNGINIVSRSATRYRISNGNNESLVSATPNTYIFDGKGWGHGLGMSQWGAKKMAELGYNYKQILEYYYTGTKVE